jgi:hypothetical protein
VKFLGIGWKCKHSWKKASVNTSWCLLGCSIGDFSALYYFDRFVVDPNPYLVMVVAICCGLMTSIMLETGIMYRQLKNLKESFKIAISMSFLSMVAMELAMNITDFALVGPGNFEFWVMPIAMTAGFLVPLPYNYYRLKKWGKSCH